MTSSSGTPSADTLLSSHDPLESMCVNCEHPLLYLRTRTYKRGRTSVTVCLLTEPARLPAGLMARTCEQQMRASGRTGRLNSSYISVRYCITQLYRKLFNGSFGSVRLRGRPRPPRFRHPDRKPFLRFTPAFGLLSMQKNGDVLPHQSLSLPVPGPPPTSRSSSVRPAVRVRPGPSESEYGRH